MTTVNKFVGNILGSCLHSKQHQSVCNAVSGAMHCKRLNFSEMGRALSHERDLFPKHAIKQVDRLFSNSKIDWMAAQESFVRFLIGERRRIVVSLDWTEFGKDEHSTIAINLITEHGRATPLLWRTVEGKHLKHNRSRHEKAILRTLQHIIPTDVIVTVLADRGFAGQAFYDFVDRIRGWFYVVRLRENTYVTGNDGRYFQVRSGVPANGRIAEYSDAMVTAKEYCVAKVVCVKHRKMKEAWSLATNLFCDKQEIVELYSRRFTCEEHFRDTKDDRFGVGLKETKISNPIRRDRLLLVNAIAVILLTLLGKAGEVIGYDKYVRANTVKIRTHSLYRQGREYVKGVIERYCNQFKETLERLVYCHITSCATYGTL